MSTVEATVIGGDAVLVKLRALPLALDEEIRLATIESDAWLHAALVEQVRKRTGNLARTLGTDILRLPHGIIQIRATAGAKYAKPLDRGTGTYGPYHHPFFARWRRGDHQGVYLHPGMRARPFVAPAVFDARPRIEARWAAIGHRVRLETGL